MPMQWEKKLTKLVFDGEDDEANVLDELVRMAKEKRAYARRLNTDAERCDLLYDYLLKTFRAKLKRKKGKQ